MCVRGWGVFVGLTGAHLPLPQYIFGVCVGGAAISSKWLPCYDSSPPPPPPTHTHTHYKEYFNDGGGYVMALLDSVSGLPACN